MISQRPSPKATTWGRCPAMRNGHSAAPVVAPRRGRPDRSRGDDLELRVEIAPERGVVGHADRRTAAGRPPRGPCRASGRWSRRGAGVAPGAPRRRPACSSAACSDADQAGGQGDGHPGCRRTRRPAPRSPLPPAAPATPPDRRTPGRARRRPTGFAHPTSSRRHRLSRCPPPSNGKHRRIGRARSAGPPPGIRCPRARLLLVGRSRPRLEYRIHRPHDAPRAPPATQSGSCTVARKRPAFPSAAAVQVASVPALRSRGPASAAAARRSRPRRRPPGWAGGPARRS